MSAKLLMKVILYTENFIDIEFYTNCKFKIVRRIF